MEFVAQDSARLRHRIARIRTVSLRSPPANATHRLRRSGTELRVLAGDRPGSRQSDLIAESQSVIVYANPLSLEAHPPSRAASRCSDRSTTCT